MRFENLSFSISEQLGFFRHSGSKRVLIFVLSRALKPCPLKNPENDVPDNKTPHCQNAESNRKI